MRAYDWVEQFQSCYNDAVKAFAAGNRDRRRYFNREQLAFLESIGCSAQEVYDFAEDWCGGQAPDFGTVLLITAARRDFFLVVQNGQPSAKRIRPEDLPAKDAAVAGFAWLPRIIEKARAKLRGEMPDELMYGCGGDRAFLKKVQIHPADFLRTVWSARDDDHKIIAYVQQCARLK